MGLFNAFIKENIPLIDKELQTSFTARTPGTDDESVIEAYAVLKDFCLSGGKRIRPLLVVLSNNLFGGDKKAALTCASAYELCHAFLLIHDDIMDMSMFRRNNPTVYKHYITHYGNVDAELKGAHMAMVTGDTLLFIAYDVILSSRLTDRAKARVLKTLNNVLQTTCHGQIIDYTISLSPDVPEERILSVYRLKTSVYSIKAPLLLGAVLCNKGEATQKILSDFAMPLGVAFQIQDDLLDLAKTSGKEQYVDFREGKHTLLVNYVLHHGRATDKDFLLKNLGKHDLLAEDAEAIKKIINRTGARLYCETMVERLAEEARLVITHSDLNPDQKKMLLDFAQYILAREN